MAVEALLLIPGMISCSTILGSAVGDRARNPYVDPLSLLQYHCCAESARGGEE
jgi:hypothetical protein